MKTVLISGANGFIGKNIARKLKKFGLRIVGINQKLELIDFFDFVYQGNLLEPLKGVFDNEKIDVFIHCAHHIGKDEYRINVEGTTLWAEQAKQNKVGMQIFISSISARKDSLSSYGQAKYELEEWFTQQNQIVFRLGLVVGNGGFFQRMILMLKKYPVLPLLDSGRTWVYLTGIDFLCNVIKDAVMDHKSLRGKVWNIFQSNPVTMRAVLEEIKKQYQTFCVFLPVPSLWILILLRMMEYFPFLKLNISSTNVIGLRQNDRLDFTSDFDKFGYSESTLADLIKMTR